MSHYFRHPFRHLIASREITFPASPPTPPPLLVTWASRCVTRHHESCTKGSYCHMHSVEFFLISSADLCVVCTIFY